MTTREALRFARVLWAISILLFVAGMIAFFFGPKLQMIFMQASTRADIIVLRSQWIGRAIVMFLISAICGIAGVVFSIKAADLER